MKSLHELRAPVEDELKIFEHKFSDAMKSRVPLLNAITRYIVRSKGKQVRPMFVFLTAKMLGGVTESTYHGAAMIELLHTATLVHDDVVDDSHERRGFFSINALWKNKIAVLVGDYLFSRGLLLSVSNGEFRLLELMSEAVREMSEGELIQIEKTRRLNLSEADYFEIIRKKTATLISSACACGASSAGVSEEAVAQAKLFGEKVGIAFQIKDDLLDFSTDDTGKPKGIDLKEKKMTLPVIYTLSHAPAPLRRKIIKTIKQHHDQQDRVKEVMQAVRENGGIDYATEKMTAIKTEALSILHHFPANPYNDALRDLVNFSTERKK